MKLIQLYILIAATYCSAQSDSSKVSVGIYAGANYIEWKQGFTESIQLSFQFKRNFISLGPEFDLSNHNKQIKINGFALNYRLYPNKIRSVISPFFTFTSTYFLRKDTREYFQNFYSDENGYTYAKVSESNNRRNTLQIAPGIGLDINITHSFYLTILAKYGLQWDEESIVTTYFTNGKETNTYYGRAPDRWTSLMASFTIGYRIPIQ